MLYCGEHLKDSYCKYTLICLGFKLPTAINILIDKSILLTPVKKGYFITLYKKSPAY